MLRGDNAHGEDGIGGTRLIPAISPARDIPATDFILQILRNAPPGSVTIIATGPLTNIAQALRKDARAMRRAGEVLIMGGCTAKLAAADLPERQGNITAEAEFNFFMAAGDARTVMASGLPITLFPMNCTHQMTRTQEWQQAVSAALDFNPALARTILRMMNAPKELDWMKFASAPVMHDVHTAFYLLYPDCYRGRRGRVDVTPEGRSDFVPDADGAVQVMEHIVGQDRLFDELLAAMTFCLMPNS